MSDTTYCMAECPVTKCKRNRSTLGQSDSDEEKYIRVSDFASICKKYIPQPTEKEDKKNKSLS